LILLQDEIAKLVEAGIKAAQTAGDLPEFDVPAIEISNPKRPEHGDYATAAMALAKLARKKPLDIATAIKDHLPPADYLSEVAVMPPGFLNFRLNEDWLKGQVETIIAEGDQLYQLEIGKGKRAQVEFVSANPSGPITIGRSRGAMIGDTMARVLEAAGYAVEREYYFNNAGRQMRLLGNSLKIRYLEALGKPVEIPGGDDESFYRGEYLIDFAKELIAEHGDAWAEKDWEPFKDYAEQKMFGWIKTTLQQVQIQHDVFFNENSLYESRAIWDVLSALEDKGYVYKSDVPENASEEDTSRLKGKGEAVWFRSTALGDEKDRVLVKASGEPTYTLPDIAYHVNKLERGFDLLVNILGADHGVQYKVVQYGVSALGYDPSKINVIINQMVRMVRDGNEVKMSTRRGVFDTLDDLIEQTSPDVVRFMLLDRTPSTHINFDLDLAVKQSNENPVYYIQNAHVRCAGIFREAEARGLSDEGADVNLLGEDELVFLRKVTQMGEEIRLAATNFEPHRIAFYTLDLARTFHPIYDRVRALHSEVPEDVAKARLRFYRAAQVTFKRLLTLMGMSAPERM
jgi:arginyl-tRNA synthetase